MYRQIVTPALLSVVLGVCIALCPSAGYSLGLGKLHVKSGLNEPLNAEIDITTITDSELRGLNVSLASRADFEAAGADRVPMLSQIKFIVAKRADGRPYLQLKTDSPVEEPFLHLLLQLEWPGGRLVREYTALVDPPAYMVGKAPTVEAPQAQNPQEEEPEGSSPDEQWQLVENVPPPQEADKPQTETAAAARFQQIAIVRLP